MYDTKRLQISCAKYTLNVKEENHGCFCAGTEGGNRLWEIHLPPASCTDPPSHKWVGDGKPEKFNIPSQTHQKRGASSAPPRVILCASSHQGNLSLISSLWQTRVCSTLQSLGLKSFPSEQNTIQVKHVFSLGLSWSSLRVFTLLRASLCLKWG